jgi:hypothetical protein
VRLKNRWYSLVQHRVHRYLDNPYELARVLDQGHRGLPVPQLFTAQSEVSQELNQKELLAQKSEI